MQNIIFIGMPGSGKTTFGKIIAKELKMIFLDFDDDIIEPSQQKSVSKILSELGNEDFLKLEEKLALGISMQNTVLSTSGSLPYSSKAMKHLSSLGTIVYLQAPNIEIAGRLEKMKTQRIVGIKQKSFGEIIKERDSLYSSYSDITFSYSGNDIKNISYSLIGLIGKNSD